MERDYDHLRSHFGLERHCRLFDWWPLKSHSAILRYTGFERLAYEVKYGGKGGWGGKWAVC